MFSLVDINLLLGPHFPLQELVDRCAALSAKPNTIQNLVDSMNKLADTYHDVEGRLQDIKELIQVYAVCLSVVCKNVTFLSLPSQTSQKIPNDTQFISYSYQYVQYPWLLKWRASIAVRLLDVI
jgi:hypothetical protein